MMKEQKVNELQQQYGLPTEILNQVVDDLGVVDNGKLGIALATVAVTKAGLVTANQAEIQQLQEELKSCQEQAKAVSADKMALARRMVNIKNRLFELGGRP